MNRTIQVVSLAVLFAMPQTSWGRRYVPKSTAPATKLTPYQQYRNKRVGKTHAGDVARKLSPRSRLSTGMKKRYAPSVTRTAGTLKRRRTRFLWHKRTRRARGGVRGPRQLQGSQRQVQARRLRQMQRQIGAFDGRTFEGRMSLYREARITKRQVRRFEKVHKSWAARYGLKTANQMLLGKVNKYLEAMSRLREQQERQSKISKRVGNRLERQANKVSPRRRAFVGRMLRQIRSYEGPRFRIFTRRGKSGGLRGLWRLSALRSLKQPIRARHVKARPAPTAGAARKSNTWGYQPLLAP